MLAVAAMHDILTVKSKQDRVAWIIYKKECYVLRQHIINWQLVGTEL